MIILVDGPEKAGKTTLISLLQNELQTYMASSVLTRKQGPWEPDDSVVAPDVRSDTEYDGYVLWDRGWPSEEVYATLLYRKRRAQNNPFLMEWLHGRATTMKYILLPTSTSFLNDLRDSTDLPVDPEKEYVEFFKYKLMGYTILYNDYTRESLWRNVQTIIAGTFTGGRHIGVYGNPKSKYWFVTHLNSGCKGDRWMPLSYTTAADLFGSAILKEKSLQYAYMFSHIGNPSLLRNKVVTAIGKEAADWVRYYTSPRIFPKLHRLNAVGKDAFYKHLTQINQGVYND